MNTSYQILDQFEPIDLNEMDSVKLMNRTDTKFLFTMKQFEAVMNEVKDQYRVLEVNGKRLNQYKTLYYDTEKLHLYAQHQKGKLNRYKIRHRTYVESETGYVEVKFKNNKGRTIKKRIKEQLPPTSWEGDSRAFLNKTQPFDPNTLIPAIWVNYCRYTLVHKTELERLTIDINLEFVKDSVIKKLDGLVIAEVKQEKRKPTAFLKMMKKYHIREGSISKYCMGIALTCEGIKKNNFKQKLITLKHILGHDTIANA
ncbi:MAG: hypothetical protein K0S53_446 [Bacteroidetes bacterium]|nr:hypothetical protein [Bacteroidota bacterium]MDF2453810.1 hypothetical protein [Bacteroidota bacterium]